MMRMMRSGTRAGALITILLTCAVLLSSCFHFDRDMKLNSDGSGSYSLTIGISEAVVSLAGSAFTKSMDDSSTQVKQAGGDARHYDQDGYSVWVFTRPFKSISELNTLLQQNPSSSSGSTPPLSQPQDTLSITETPGFFVNSFHLTGHISLKNLGDTSSVGSGIDVSSYLKDMRESVSITMPGWISSYAKGGTVRGNTITYTVHYNEEATIDVVGGGVNPPAIYITAGIGLLVVLIISGVIFWRRRSRHARTAEPALVSTGAASDASVFPSSPPPARDA